MLTPQEQKELEAIDAELSQREKAGFVQPKGLTPDEAQELAAIEQELAQRQNVKTIKTEEANLGVMNRLQYSLEPIESNRKAFLIQQFGAENVKEDEEGNTYIRQGDTFKPVNKEGFSVADVADVIGSAPEILGAGAGAVAGLGAGSIPAAVAGSAAGSVARQGLSALIGTPQVASPIERATEVGLSAALGGAGAGAGKVISKAGKAVMPKLSKVFPKINIAKEGKKLLRISKQLDIPDPTPGQLSGGRTLEIEKALGVRRFFGRKIRKQTEKQVEAIKKNLVNEVGEFIDTDSSREAVGTSLKNLGAETIKRVKQTSSELFDEVTSSARGVAIPAKQTRTKLLHEFQKMGFFDTSGNALEHTSRTGLTETQFKRVQDVFGKIIKDIERSATNIGGGTMSPGTMGADLTADTLNTMRKFIDANIKEGGKLGYDDALLLKMRDTFLNVTEEMLEAQDPVMKQKFKTARALWAKQFELKKIFEKGGKAGLGIKDLSDEKVLKTVFADKKKVQLLKQLTNDEAVEKAGKTWVNDLLTTTLGQEDKITAQAALNSLKKNREALIEAIGRKSYMRLRDNLFYLERIGRPINPSRTAITEMMSLDLKQIGAGALERGAYGARATVENLQREIPKYLERLPGQGAKGLSALTDQSQRELGYLTRNPALRTPQSEQRSNRGRK